MRSALILALLALACAPAAQAQQATVRQFTAPLAGTVRLSAVADKYNAQVYSLAMPDPDAKAEKIKLRKAKEEVSRRFPRKSRSQQLKTTAAPLPLMGIHYVADSFPGIPPDNDMALSQNQRSVAVMNSYIAVHDAQTGQMVSRKTLKLFSNVVGLNNFMYDYRYDPKIIYDPAADKFICVMLNGTDDRNWIIVAFSQSNDPAGLWNFYKFYGNYAGDTTWFDYPSIAITGTEFFLTGNKIKFGASWQAGFTQSLIYQFNKQSGYNGDANIVYQIWENVGYNGKNIRNLYPVKGGGSITGPEQYFLSNRNFDVQNDTVFLVKLPDTIGSANNILTVTALTSNLPYGVPPQGRQPDTSAELATNDARVLGAFREGNEIQFVSTTIQPSTGNAAVYHGVISNFATAPSLQAGYVGVDTLDLGYPNISFAGSYSAANHAIISCNYTGPQTYPGMGAFYFDGSQYSELLSIKSGDSSIRQLPGKSQRWGDYMGSQPQWNAIGKVWVAGIFGRKDKDYGNYMAELTSPFYTHVGDQIKSPAAALFPNPAFEFVKFEFEAARDEALSFAIYNAEGKKVDELLRQRCKAGNNLIQFNTGSLAPGIYFLKVADAQGKTCFTKRFLKQ